MPPRSEVACTIRAAAPQAEAGNLNLCLFGKVKIISPWVSGAFLSLCSPYVSFHRARTAPKKELRKKNHPPTPSSFLEFKPSDTN